MSDARYPHYRLPAEWEKQSAVLITWPHAQSDWKDQLVEIEQLYVNLSQVICRYQKLLIIAYDAPLQTHITSLFSCNSVNLDNVQFFTAKTNDTWTRDYGPICLTFGTKIRVLNFNFNGWGNKYSANLDNLLNTDLLRAQVLLTNENQDIKFTLEGGSIDSDGNGSILTTSQCLLNKNRNPNFTAQEVEQYLKKILGIQKILWIDEGYLAGDDTDNHIDVLARFTDSQTIIYIQCNDKKDEHYLSSKRMQAQLERFRNKDGHTYKLVPLPFPAAIYNNDGHRLAASYANFLIINGAVLVPIYNDANDKIALNIIKQCFKDREIIGIPFSAAIQQNGSLHCLTMQLPSGVLK